MDIQFILEEYSCAAYVVEYINKTNRGISDLNRELIKLSDEYPDLDFATLATKVGAKLLDSVELSCQEAAWYLLKLHMSESTRKCEFIPTMWPHERQLARKTVQQMEDENLEDDSRDVWWDNVIQKYEKRPVELNDVTLAQYSAWWTVMKSGQCRRRTKPKVIRYVNYDVMEKDNYRREQCLLHVPFRNEELEIIDQDRYRELYELRKVDIMEARKKFEARVDIEAVLAECHRLFSEEECTIDMNNKTEEYSKSKAVHNDFVQSVRDEVNDDMISQVMERMSAVVRKRENTVSAEQYCMMMRTMNVRQRDLVLEVIHRSFIDGNRKPLQIFLTGPAGCGKTFTMKAMMETYNRFSRTRKNNYNAFVATASTGVTAAALGGTTVHSAFRLSNNCNVGGLKTEALNQFRATFSDIWAIFVDECSMIGAKLLQQVDVRLKQIFHEFEIPFGGKDIILCGDLRQLPPVRQLPIYKRTKLHFASETVWRSLEYYPLEEIMRQSHLQFSTVLTKIGDGDALTEAECEFLEARFISHETIERTHPAAIRLFHTNEEIDEYHASIFEGCMYETHIAEDTYIGARTKDELTSARNKVHKMKLDETSGLPYKIELLQERPYMLRVNVDVSDSLVNGVVGILKYIERSQESGKILRLWLNFEDLKIGKLLRRKAIGHYSAFPEIHKNWTPISLRSSTITLPSKMISCKRCTFPIVPASAISIHKAQGATYSCIVYEYKRTHDQQLVYVALSRCSNYEGLFLTNKNADHRFYHRHKKPLKEIHAEFSRLSQCRLQTLSSQCRDFLHHARNRSPDVLTLCTMNVQSLHAHLVDINVDSVIPLCGLLAISETWLSNENCGKFSLPEYKLISCCKRNNGIMAGGVAIYERVADSHAINSKYRPLLRLNKENTELEEIGVRCEEIGDICQAETTIDGRRTMIVAVYFANSSTVQDKMKFCNLYMSPYIVNNRCRHFYDLPIVFCGDFNIDFRSADGVKFREYMLSTFNCELSNSPETSSTRNMTCIDAVFFRDIPRIKTLVYVSYFSHHRPLLTVT